MTSRGDLRLALGVAFRDTEAAEANGDHGPKLAPLPGQLPTIRITMEPCAVEPTPTRDEFEARQRVIYETQIRAMQAAVTYQQQRGPLPPGADAKPEEIDIDDWLFDFAQVRQMKLLSYLFIAVLLCLREQKGDRHRRLAF